MFWETLRTARIPILPLDAADLASAWRILQAFSDQNFSFTDCSRRHRAFQRWPT